jgi:hypothetical protein
MRRRYPLGLFVLLSLFFSLGLVGCGGGSSSGTLPTPTSVVITPNGSSVSVELGQTLQFTGTALNNTRQQLTTVPVTYLSSNPSVLTFVPSGAGLACAGSWNAFAQVCTAGSIGVTQVTAVANGVSSPVVTVYVHDHVDTITFQRFDPIFPPPPNGPCVTSALIPGVQIFRDYQAKAFSNGVDITNSVGSFTFAQVSGTVVTLSTSASELNNTNGGQITEVRATAGRPGITQIYASVGGVNSAPIPFETCLIQSIQLQVGSASTNTTFSLTKGGAGVVVTPTVFDRDTPPRELTVAQATPLLTWSSLSPANVTVSSSGAISARNVGGTAITASCIPPNCNVGSTDGLPPSQQPVFPSNVITGTVTGTSSTGTVYVTSTCNTGSGVVVEGCQPALLPVNTSTNIIGNRIILPSAPNSFMFNAQGSKGLLGSTQGLMVFTPSGASGTSPLTQYNSAPGVLLAISNDGNSAIVADNVHTPNQVFLVNITTNAITPLLINGATAAAFSPDGYKIFIAATDSITSPGTPLYHLYVYSSTQALQAVTLSAPVTGISFYANGALAYLNGGAPNAITVYNVCDDTLAQTIPLPNQPADFQAALDGLHAIGLDSPNLDVLNPPNPQPGQAPTLLIPPPTGQTCPFSLATPVLDPVNLGQANFTPLKMIVTPDSSRAYIFAKDRGSVFVYNFGVNTVSAIALNNSPAPVSATLSSDGSQLYVGGSDGAVHALSTISSVDLQEITFPPNNDTNNNALCTNVPGNCLPDLIAFLP